MNMKIHWVGLIVAFALGAFLWPKFGGKLMGAAKNVTGQ